MFKYYYKMNRISVQNKRRTDFMKELRTMINNTSLTKTQKMIAKYVLDNSADACFMTSTEIAMKLGVSESSVIRFSRLWAMTDSWISRKI